MIVTKNKGKLICSMILTLVIFFTLVFSLPVFAVTFKYAHTCAADHPYELGGLKLAELVAEKTNNGVTINTYPNGTLGGEREINEGILLGTIDMTLCSFGVAATFVPELDILNLPFIFKGPEHFENVVNSEIGSELLAAGDKHGFKLLALTAPVFRHPMNGVRPIETPEDFKGLKMRLMEVPMHIDTYNTLGSIPLAIPFPELYSALQLGTVDGNENAMTTLYTQKFYEVQKYISELPVFSNGAVFMVGLEQWNSLTPEQQEAFYEALPVYKETVDKSYLEQEVTNLDLMVEAGMIVSTPEVGPFQEKVKPIYEKFVKENPGAAKYIEAIQAID